MKNSNSVIPSVTKDKVWLTSIKLNDFLPYVTKIWHELDWRSMNINVVET